MSIMLKKFILGCLFLSIMPVWGTTLVPQQMNAQISLKMPGNQSISYPLTFLERNNGVYELDSSEKLPVAIIQKVISENGKSSIEVQINASEKVWFNFSERIQSTFRHNDCLFYMPGFWYRKNLRSPKEAPSFHTSDSWTVREDRLSAPLTGIFNEKDGEYISVLRLDKLNGDALTTHDTGEVILSGKSSIGATGFVNEDGISSLSVSFPYWETPRSYIRKLTLASEAKAFYKLDKGESITLKWEVKNGKAEDYSTFVRNMWEYCYDTMEPQPVKTAYTVEYMKNILSKYFVESYVGNYSLKYNSGVHLNINDCCPNGISEIGFVGRVLLNAFNSLEYGEQIGRPELVSNGKRIFDSYLQNGFTTTGFFREFVNFEDNTEEQNLSIRRQSEGIFATLYYLEYERNAGRIHPDWEKRVKNILKLILEVQKENGSFPRKFRDNQVIVDNSGGSTPSAVLPLVMAYTYFKDKDYLNAAKKAASYLENEIISKADYFSSTLDANCEDKEASLYAATATYYLALVTKGKEKKHYAELTRQAAYFALSWYYLWDVPFAEGQMLGDLSFKSRGWGNVSVENNHIDVFIFDFVDVLRWLSEQYNEPRFSSFAEVISTSMRQLVPYSGHLCGIAREGYYPEVVQHTHWDYGKNGKGFYNDIFAPGWTVASLWELFTPGRAEKFLLKD
nr:hypothetical protein [Coprobacter secundus]